MMTNAERKVLSVENAKRLDTAQNTAGQVLRERGEEGEAGLCSRNAAKIQKNTTMNTFALLVRKVKAGCAAEMPPRYRRVPL